MMKDLIEAAGEFLRKHCPGWARISRGGSTSTSFNQQGFFISPHAFHYCHTFRNIIPIHLLRTDHSDMLRSILLAAVFSLGLSTSMKPIAGCSRSSESPECPDQEITVEGHLRLFGNEPFVRTAVITDDDSRYYLLADSGELDAMWNARSRLEITGHCLDEHEYELPGIYIDVRSWEPATDP